MTKVVCDNCKLEIDVPEGYNAPYIQCPDCASFQKFVRSVKGEPKFKILGHKSRERANNQAIRKTTEEIPQSQSINPQKGKTATQHQAQPIEDITPYKLIDRKQIILDSIGEDGLLKAYKLVGNYLWSTSDKVRNNGRAKAIRRMMKEKYPLEIASKAIELAERSPEGLKYARQKLITVLVVIALIIVGIISVLLAFL